MALLRVPTEATATARFLAERTANDGSEVPATATQDFVDGTPQALTLVEDLGFSKAGFNFAGWGTAADATESAYADGASYTASAAATLYAMWSAIPVYSVNIPVNEYGSVTASPATATAGTEITLSNTPNAGYQFISYSVIDADGTTVTVTDGKFTMPAKDVTVTVTFTAINYNINVVTTANGSVMTDKATAAVGTCVTITTRPANNYELATLIVTDSDGTSVTVSGTGNSRTFVMPAKNVDVAATFKGISYSIDLRPMEHGSVTADPAIATVGTSVTLTAVAELDYKLATLNAYVESYYTVEPESERDVQLGWGLYQDDQFVMCLASQTNKLFVQVYNYLENNQTVSFGTGLNAGKYQLCQICRFSDSEQWQRCENYGTNSLVAEVSATTMTIRKPDLENVSFTVNSLSTSENPEVGIPMNFIVNVTNTGESSKIALNLWIQKEIILTL